MPATTLDIILPSYNPLPGWDDKIISAFKEICKQLPSTQIRIILVNDGSVSGITDSNISKIKNAIHFFNYISYTENKGKGFALRRGVAESTAEIIIYTDVDFPYTTESILKLWKILSIGNTDIAAGIADKNYYTKVPASRKLISRCLHFLTKYVLRLKISDTQRGLKGFNEKGKALFLRTTINRYLFDLEFIYLASRKKNNVVLKPVVVQLKENITFSRMKGGILFQEGLNFLKLFFRSILGLA